MIRGMDVTEVCRGTAAPVPTRAEAEEIARALLGDQGTRLAHVRTAGSMAARLGVLFHAEEAALLVAAATLHDVGYSPRIARTGFHPLDGALHLRSIGLSERLCSVVAHHSEADMLAAQHGIVDLDEQFPRERTLLADALVYADMHSAPDGRMIRAEHRLADIASRRPHPVEVARGQRLRAAMARVGAALHAHQEWLSTPGRVDVPSPREARSGRPWPAGEPSSPPLDG
jgi:HD domain